MALSHFYSWHLLGRKGVQNGFENTCEVRQKLPEKRLVTWVTLSTCS